ncbi:clock controled protein (Ccg-8) [Talaromyces proteolyticus]|uniref:Clock controled protein (Ccg-8) n=1 Tax=Talaromyces proteolyticus TaxID=1131652 RepID=A0AAD4L225_9EURO|nr:clock controled protein (Ccg-8) [Talaromyces proteolyticus]KAH8701789.1 clock controled protein (Ccg-8) [Talaromyces proteolyticus]
MMDVDDDRARRAASVLSMDDIEAAQALEGLRSDFVHSPPSHPTALPQAHSQQQQLSATPNQPHNGHPEPLLSLLTSTHPLISSAINGSMSAYESSKSYSTRFKYGAEFLERNIGSPVANTVGTVSRKTGVEGGLRWAFQRRDTNELGEPNKRRKTEDSSENTDMEKTMMQRDRSTSDTSYSETLPPYDDHKSPSYEEVNSSDQMANDSAQNQRSWHNRLVISTSGLGVAMSDESLRRLAYCLKWLKWANERLNNAVLALKNALHKWEERSADENSSQNRAMLSQHIQAVREDVLRTLRQVVDIVSKYTGGALPENARNLVRRHLVSLPQRFKLASTSDSSVESGSATSDEATSARRVLVLAQEGLDMMTQVHRVVDDTLVSAQTWCERLNRKMPDLENGQHDAPPAAQDSRSMPMDIKPPIIETANREVEMTDSDAV